MVFRACAVIPVYNHKDRITTIVEKLNAAGLFCVIIDDGSNIETQAVLRAIATNKTAAALHRLEINQGKGAAMIAGFELAQKLGYTHALQIDADGQHNTDDVPHFLELSRNNPDTLIAGQPVYDASAPASRLIARKISRFWVYIETLSLKTPDPLCGFRVYPLEPVCRLAATGILSPRMQIDTELLVHLIWMNIKVIAAPTAVIYPDNNLSHFRYVADNFAISRMHTRLFFGMLRRLPRLLSRKLRRPDSAPLHWSEIRERGSQSGMQFMVWIYRTLGQTMLNLMLLPVVAYFFLTNKPSRDASREFLNRAYEQGASHKYLSRRPSTFSSFLHFLTFARAVADRAASWLGGIRNQDIVFEKEREIIGLAESGVGIVILSSHLGNIELCRAIADRISAAKLNALIFTENAEIYNSALRKINKQAFERLIQVSRIGPETAIDLKNRIDRGEFIAILGDRTPVNPDSRVELVKFLGEEAPFAQGPFILASLMDCPVYLMFCLKRDGKYHVYFEHFADRIELPRKSREASLRTIMQQYARRLEYYCLEEPFQWFNFYDFWRKDRSKPGASNL